MPNVQWLMPICLAVLVLTAQGATLASAALPLPGVWPIEPHPGGPLYVFGDGVGGEVVNGWVPRLGPPELVAADGTATPLEYSGGIKDLGPDREHLVDGRVPANLAAGDYTLRVRGKGFETRPIKVVAPPTPRTGKIVRLAPSVTGENDVPAIGRALEAAGPGGTVVLAAGSYVFNDGVVHVVDRRLVGYGATFLTERFSEVIARERGLVEGVTVVGDTRGASLAGGSFLRCRFLGDGLQVAGGNGSVVECRFEAAYLFHGGGLFVRDTRFEGFGSNHAVQTFAASDCLFLQNTIDGRDRGFVASLNWGPLERCCYARNRLIGLRFAGNGNEGWLVEQGKTDFIARDCLVLGLSATDHSGPLIGVYDVAAERLTFRRLSAQGVQIYARSRPKPPRSQTNLRIYDSELPGLWIDGPWQLERVYRTNPHPSLLNQLQLTEPKK